ncbi:MAG: saccharopine dehydrogenase NADP-binding domain-containing protein [Nitrospinota bacterium]|nr:saccharopine dehydrogenase NADP-binding domain-containing protein [Nitrospinota bacterium]
MSLKYAVLGAGKQGVAAAYDLARLGDATEVRLFDLDGEAALQGADKVNKLLQTQIVQGKALNVDHPSVLVPALRGVHSTISAVPYKYNLQITEAAIEVRSNICDLGGHTETTRQQLALGDKAKAAGVTITPDCGMGPGLNINMGIRAMDYLDEPEDVYIWDGGLPQKPEPPWNYHLTFNANGLINEYCGDAWFIRGGQPTQVPCLTEIETLEFPQPLGMMEAAVTSGGLSTAPWTFKDKLRRMENKTLRYPGHWDQFKAFQSLGLFDPAQAHINGHSFVPRDLLSAMLTPKITPEPPVYDVCLIRTQAVGRLDGSHSACTLDFIETYDDKTGFTAMEQITGWHASIIAIIAAQDKLPKGAVPVELALRGKMFDYEITRRGWELKREIFTSPASP